MNKLSAFLKKEPMLTVSLAVAIISLFITPPSKELLSSIDWHTLATLFMLLSVLEGFKTHNIFAPIIRLTSGISSMRRLTVFFVYSVFFSSMFVTNDVSLIIFVPLTIILFRAGQKEKYIIPVLTLENIAAIRGSLLMPFGSPQNLYLFTRSGIPVQDFLLTMLPLWIGSAVLLYIFILFLYRKNLGERIESEKVEDEKKSDPKKKAVHVILFIAIIASIVTRTNLWPYLAGAVFVLLLIFDPKILLKTDYVLLLTFLCFFIFSSSICSNPAIARFLSRNVTGNEYWWSILLSQVISNVPASIVLWPFTKNLRALLYGLDSAGLCSIIGSLASVINLRIYVRSYPGKTLAFIRTFQIISLIFFAIIVIPQFLLCR
jgi:Na+/H+ antiporter NhaD/arsenite permease-like protein